jgi:hypothetical protein
MPDFIRLWPRVLPVLLAALVLCWTALVNGQPFFHSDTQAYIRSPDAAVAKVLGPRFATPWLNRDFGALDQRVEGVPQQTITKHSYEDDEVLAGRSIYYGALAYLGERAGGFWLTIAIQALSIAVLLRILLHAAGLTSLRAYAMGTALLALATTAPFFADFLMPDIWSGLLIGSLGVLFAYGDRLGLAERIVLAALVAFAGLAHNTNILILALMLGLGLVLFWLVPAVRPRSRLALGIAALGLVAGIGGTALFGLAVKTAYGKPPITPPFLTARIQADEAGARYLKTYCPSAAFEVCRYRDRLPMETDQFLWGAPDGVFQTVNTESRRALSAEQFRFTLAVAGAYPFSQLSISLGNAANQFVTMALDDFAYDEQARQNLGREMPAKVLARAERTPAWKNTWPVRILTAVDSTVYYLALAGILAFFAYAILIRPALSRLEPNARAVRFAAVILAGILVNAGVCGALSALHGRYAARVAWLVPLAGYVLVMQRKAVPRMGIGKGAAA